jgi:hypothetical protein
MEGKVQLKSLSLVLADFSIWLTFLNHGVSPVSLSY